jgi:hypothetical protein
MSLTLKRGLPWMIERLPNCGDRFRVQKRRSDKFRSVPEPAQIPAAITAPIICGGQQ